MPNFNVSDRIRALLERGGASPDRVRRAALRGVAFYGRLSTPMQAVSSIGSQLAQRDYGRMFLEALGIPAVTITVFEAWGESGSGIKPRQAFRRLMSLLSQGQIGLIVVPEHHRLSRNTIDTQRLLKAAARAGAIIIINGQAYDAADPNELLILHILAAVSEHSVSSSAAWSLKGRFALARRAALRFSLPSGLVWASPNDADYVSRLEEAGLGHWLDSIHTIPKERRACSIVEGVQYFILPYPDSEVYRSIELRLQWLLETRSVSAVRARIHDGYTGWPTTYVGQVPSIRLARYRPDITPTWERAETAHLARWFENPALYGIYAFYAEGLAPAELRAARRARRNGAHYGRAIAEHLPPLPDALDLLR